MPTSRYDERKILRNKTFQYANSAIFQKRRVDVIEQYNTPDMVYPSAEDLEDISIITRNWGVGVKYFNLADEFYGSPQYWWVLAWFNLRPLETDYRPGDVVLIPMPLESVLSAFGLL